MLCPPGCIHWMFLCFFPAWLHTCTSPGYWRLLLLSLMCSLPLGPCARTGRWGGTVASARTVPVGKLSHCSLTGLPHSGSLGVQMWRHSYHRAQITVLRSPCSAPTSVGGVEAARAASRYQQLLAFTYPMVVGAGLGWFCTQAQPWATPKSCVFFSAPTQWTCVGGLGSCPLGVAGRSNVPGAGPRTCHKLLCPLLVYPREQWA